MDVLSLLGSTLGLGMMAGLNLYATVLAAGLGIRFGWIHPAGAFAHLQILADPWVLGIAGAAFLVEFLADKIPWVDSLWDGFHTVIRPLGAALLGITAAGGMDPASRVVLGILTGAVAFTGHTAKAGTRLAVNHSPEPFSNIALSLGEDFIAVFGSWLAAAHPLIALGLVVAFLLLFAGFAPSCGAFSRPSGSPGPARSATFSATPRNAPNCPPPSRGRSAAPSCSPSKPSPVPESPASRTPAVTSA
jgi:hypothetical protein